MDASKWNHALDVLEADSQNILAADRRSFRGTALLRAVRNLRGITPPKHFPQDLDGIPGVGTGTIERLEKILAEGATRQPVPPAKDPFKDIYGLGPQKKKQLHQMGIRTIEDLKSRPEILTDATRIYLEHLSELQERISLKESQEFAALLSKALMRFPGLGWEMAGSFRRKAQSQGDWDLLCSHADPETAMPKVVERMRKHTEVIEFGSGPSKWEGIVRSPTSGKMRRLDIRMTRPDSYPAALLYFTGSKEHNIKLRNKAKKKGWRLNEHALLDATGKPIKVTSEEDIYRLLDTPYVIPEQRGGSTSPT